MIPLVMPPLSDLSVLVTRPEGQTAGLAARIAELGGEPIEFPALSIEAVEYQAPAHAYDLVAFLSVNGAKHGAATLEAIHSRNAAVQIAAIGKATAAALSAAGVSVNVLPETDNNSEGLLALLAASPTPRRILVVCGEGGRRLLHQELSSSGAIVDSLEVYRRKPAAHGAEEVAALEARWREHGIGIVTATSVDTLQALTQILTDEGNRLLRRTPLLAVSERVRTAAMQLGFQSECVISRRPDEEALVGTLAYWRARSR